MWRALGTGVARTLRICDMSLREVVGSIPTVSNFCLNFRTFRN